MFRIAVIGVGRWGRNIVKTLCTLRQDRVIDHLAICDVDEVKLREVSNQFKIEYMYNNVDDLLTKFKPDAVIVATPIDKLYDVSKIVLSYGVHALIEKPVATSSNQIQDLIDSIYKNFEMMAEMVNE